jgi:hypothetical protein
MVSLRLEEGVGNVDGREIGAAVLSFREDCVQVRARFRAEMRKEAMKAREQLIKRR